ncbi:hypothetical protein XENORESO_003835 [Xenotaenia resolanae]|uniref:Uncharacterized protein n=1 Tax=Xenotaenia resolanae TaxID=208358 RepID=A0ABV0VRF7_9TELE
MHQHAPFSLSASLALMKWTGGSECLTQGFYINLSMQNKGEREGGAAAPLQRGLALHQILFHMNLCNLSTTCTLIEISTFPQFIIFFKNTLNHTQVLYLLASAVFLFVIMLLCDPM